MPIFGRGVFRMEPRLQISMSELAAAMHRAWSKMETFNCDWDKMPDAWQDELTNELDTVHHLIDSAYWLGFRKVGE